MIKSFFEQVRDYLHTNYKMLTCGQLGELYYDFSKYHKEYGKTDYNITGFSEFLVNSYIDKVIEETSLIALGDQKIGGQQPDLCVFEGDKLKSVISVKANRVMTTFIYRQDLHRLENVKATGENVKSLTVSFYKGCGTKSIRKIEEEATNHRILLLDIEHEKNLYEQIAPHILY